MLNNSSTKIMIPLQPFLIKAVYDWILANNQTPYIMVNTTNNETIPPHIINEDKVILSISPSAVVNLLINNDIITFSATFNNIPYDIDIPTNKIMSIYNKEFGQGMIFDTNIPDPLSNDTNITEIAKPTLKIIR